MGYTTTFDGEFKLDRPLAAEHQAYLNAFSETRRVTRDAAVTAAMADPVRDAVGLPVGEQGGYHVGGVGEYDGAGILNYNEPPAGQPGLWCQWVPSRDGTAIVWDEGEKFYDWQAWLRYLIANFLKPWGYILNGEVDWHGDSSDDEGILIVEANRVGIRYVERVLSDTQWDDED